MGTYPSFAFTPSDDAVIVWAAGQIYSVPLSTNERGEKVASLTPPSPIRFIAHIEKKLAETLRGGVDVLKQETQDTQRVRALKELRVDDHGERVVFQAAGVSYLQKVGKKDATKVPVLHKLSPLLFPILHPRCRQPYYSRPLVGYEFLLVRNLQRPVWGGTRSCGCPTRQIFFSCVV